MLERFRWVVLAVVAALFMVAACEEKKSHDDDDDGSTFVGAGGGPTGSGGSLTSAVGGASSSSASSSVQSSSSSTGGGMTGCAAAMPLTLGAPENDSIDPAGDDDYFVFNAAAGDWLALLTIANPDDDPTFVDTVITLYDGNGSQQLAESDDATPRLGTDSELFYRVPQTGQYCVRVQEYSEWANMSPVGDPSFVYELHAIVLDPFDLPWFNEDEDPSPSNDTPQSAQPLITEPDNVAGSFAYIAGMLTPGTDVDYYSFTTTSSTLSTNVFLMPDGASGHGSTQGPGLVRIRDVNGAVLAQLDYQLGADEVWIPSSGNTTYRIEVARPNTSVGANDFFFFKVHNLSSSNENESETNGTSAQADVATPQQDGSFTRYFIQGAITPTGDVDYWSFNATAGQVLIVVCTAARVGSGLIGFNVALRNPSDTATLQTETEVATQDLIWETGGSMPPVTLPANGTYYMRFTATGQTSGVLGTQYLCGLHLQ